MSSMAAAAPLDFTPSDLKMASFPTHCTVKDKGGEGWAWQYSISSGVNVRVTNVGFEEGTAEMSSTLPE